MLGPCRSVTGCPYTVGTKGQAPSQIEGCCIIMVGLNFIHSANTGAMASTRSCHARLDDDESMARLQMERKQQLVSTCLQLSGDQAYTMQMDQDNSMRTLNVITSLVFP